LPGGSRGLGDVYKRQKISRRAQGKNPFIRLKIDYMPVINVYKKKIEINLNDVTVMDMSNS
jgi:hypothetical protein